MPHTTLPLLHIRLLGTCSVTYKETSLRATDSHSKKLWLLFAFMVLNRNREISQDEYIELLWDKEKSRNPVSALKTLMHRLRKYLEALEYPISVIIPHHGAYAIDPRIPCQVDTEKFSRLCKEADTCQGTELHRSKLRQALLLYQGDFIPESKNNAWISSLHTQYHALFLHSAQTMIELLISKEAYAEAANLCWQALTYAPYHENIHYHLIHALYLSGNPQAALTQYNNSRNLFLSHLSQLPSGRFQELYKLITTGRNNIETDIDLIQDSLTEKKPKGTFFCEYEVFRELYRLEERIVKRTQSAIFLCLITIAETENDKNLLGQNMLLLKEAILNSLRGCDIFSRYNPSQYLLLVPAPDTDTMRQILNRIDAHYQADKSSVRLEYAIRQLQ